jgi:hypothetical protein
MPKGICPKCGQLRYGWSLLSLRNQSCLKCGTELLITEDVKSFTEGYPPFTAEVYKFKSLHKATPDQEKAKDATVKE